MFPTLATRQQGFTLIELVITVAIVGILAGIVVPSFSSFVQENRLNAQMNNLIASVHMARAEASTRRSIVTLCASTNGASCNTSAWENGWIIFTDDNDDGDDTNDGNAVMNTGDELIRFQESFEGNSTVRELGFSFAGSGQIIFNTNGFMLSNSPDSGTLTLCDGRGIDEARAIIINISGTSRMATDENGNGIADSHSGAGNDIVCP